MVSSKMKGKEWYPIVTPAFFGDFTVGETMAMDPQKIVGRVVEASLTDLTGDTNKYYFKFFFKISEVKDKKAQTIFMGHDCTRDFLARIVRRRSNRIDMNIIVDLKDAKMRVKSVAVSNRPVSKAIETKVRHNINQVITESMNNMTLEEFLMQMVDGKLQQKIRKTVSKVYPMKQFEFRKTEMIR
jgi:small subunit ribosomal protein S3Ae